MSRRSLLAVLGALAAVGASLAPVPGGAHATADPADVADVMLADVGAGLALVGEAPDRAGSLTRTWEGAGGTLTITGFVVSTPPGHRLMMDALAEVTLGFDVVAEPSLALGSWLLPEGDTEPGEGGFAAMVVASRDHLFAITLAATDPAADAAAFVLELARRQVTAAGGPPDLAIDTEPRQVDDDALLRFVPDDPPPGYGLTSSLTMSGEDELDTTGLPNPEVGEFLNDRSANVARVWGGGDLTVGVGITRYPYAIFAAAALGVYEDHVVEPATIDAGALTGVPHAVTSREPATRDLSAAFRRGDVLVTVFTSYDGDATEAAAGALLVDMVHAVDDRLPPIGGTAPHDFPSPPSRIAGLALTAVFVTAAVAGARAFAWLGARRVRRRWASQATDPTSGDEAVPLPPPAPGGTVIVLDDDAAHLRGRGRIVVGVQLVTVVVGIVALSGDFAWTGVIVAAGALLFGLLFSRWWLQHERSLLGPKAPPRALVIPRLPGAVMGVVALAVLGIGVSYLMKGVRYLVLPTSLAQLKWSNLLGVSPRAVAVLFAVGGLAVTVLGGVLWRIARAFARARVDGVLRVDRRPPILYLRSFSDDGVGLPVIASARRPLFELFSVRGAEPFEEVIAWELTTYGPVVAVGRPGGQLASLGAAREHLDQDTWHEEIAERMRDAGMIVLAPGETAGLAWELREIVDGGHLGKTVFVFPPLAPIELARRWHHTAGLLAASGHPLGALPAPPATLHTVRVGDGGALHVTVASTRDEATYRVAVDRAVEQQEPVERVEPDAHVEIDEPAVPSV